MLNCKKVSKCCFLLILLFFIIFYNYKLIVHVNTTASKIEFESPLDKQNDVENHIDHQKNHLDDNQVQLENQENNKWLVNFNIVQYSSYVITKDHNHIDIEALIFALNPQRLDYFIPDDYVCLLSTGKDKRVIIVPADKSYIISKPLTKVICRYQYDDQLIDSDFSVAILNKIKENSEKIWIKKIIYQTASRIDANKISKRVAHCAYLSNSNVNKIDSWIDIHREIGVAKISFYFQDRSIVKRIQQLNEKYKDFLLFKDLNTLKNFYCVDDDENSNRCVKSFDLISRLNSQHELLSLQDCFINYRYEYEIMSNYGINEIVLPRVENFNQQALSSCLLCEKTVTSISLYDYVAKLFGKNIQQKSLSLKRVSYIDMDTSFFDLLNNNKNETKIYSTKNNVKIAFERKNNENLNHLLESFNITKCIKNDLRLVAIKSDTHGFRSIFNTSSVQTIPKFEKVNETNANFIINFQDLNSIYYQNTAFNLSDLEIDIEYFMFLINAFKMTKC